MRHEHDSHANFALAPRDGCGRFGGMGGRNGHPPQRKASAMNIKTSNGKLIIEVDVSPSTLKGAPMSSTGKSRVVASTHGFTGVALDSGAQVKVSLNVITR